MLVGINISQPCCAHGAVQCSYSVAGGWRRNEAVVYERMNVVYGTLLACYRNGSTTSYPGIQRNMEGSLPSASPLSHCGFLTLFCLKSE